VNACTIAQQSQKYAASQWSQYDPSLALCGKSCSFAANRKSWGSPRRIYGPDALERSLYSFPTILHFISHPKGLEFQIQRWQYHEFMKQSKVTINEVSEQFNAPTLRGPCEEVTIEKL